MGGEGELKPPASRSKDLRKKLKTERNFHQKRLEKIKAALRHLKNNPDAADFHDLMAETRHYRG